MYQRPKQMTDEQERELVRYAKERGRHWKRDLRQDWEHAAQPGELQVLRNVSWFGPRGLERYRLPYQPPSWLRPEREVASHGPQDGDVSGCMVYREECAEGLEDGWVENDDWFPGVGGIIDSE